MRVLIRRNRVNWVSASTRSTRRSTRCVVVTLPRLSLVRSALRSVANARLSRAFAVCPISRLELSMSRPCASSTVRNPARREASSGRLPRVDDWLELCSSAAAAPIAGGHHADPARMSKGCCTAFACNCSRSGLQRTTATRSCSIARSGSALVVVELHMCSPWHFKPAAFHFLHESPRCRCVLPLCRRFANFCPRAAACARAVVCFRVVLSARSASCRPVVWPAIARARVADTVCEIHV